MIASAIRFTRVIETFARIAQQKHAELAELRYLTGVTREQMEHYAAMGWQIADIRRHYLATGELPDAEKPWDLLRSGYITSGITLTDEQAKTIYEMDCQYARAGLPGFAEAIRSLINRDSAGDTRRLHSEKSVDH